MQIVRRYMVGSIFVALGIIFLYLDMASSLDHITHGEHMDHETPAHTVKLLGIGEMTWMWFSMALAHFFFRDCRCKCRRDSA